ncbi:PQQ-binding-like beta-propeller repeat protein [Streptomyces sp. B6B3]|uniref:outer membrane protein assembly factor BamB family protein n=1 Tax=Streptomyces sp. B6B3 TaxID=3153570 RepID=UPI00325C48C3
MTMLGGAALLALVATTLLVVDRGGSGPAEVWRTPATDADVGRDADLALWLDGSVLTRVTPTHVTGFDAAEGGRLWEADEPAETRAVCAASEGTNDDGIGAVLYTFDGDDEECRRLGVIDTRNGGSLLWSTDLRDSTDDVDESWWTGGDSAVTVTESTVSVSAVPFTGFDSFRRYDLATGDEAPALELPDTDCPGDAVPNDLVGHDDARVVVVTSCEPWTDGESVASWTSVFDADSGELLWTREQPVTEPVLGVVSGEPLILHEGLRSVSPTTGELLGGRLAAYSDTGEPLWRLDREDADSGGQRVVQALADGVLVQETLTEEGDRRGEFAGYDLGSGERRWRTRVPESSEFLGVAGDTGQALLGAYAFDRDDGGRMTLTWLDLSDGATREFGTVPFPLEGGDDPTALVAFDEDRLYFAGNVEREFQLRAYDR